MKRVALVIIFVLVILKVNSQGDVLYQTGLTAEQNLNAIGNLARYSTGGVGFDNRYEGVKGSPRLFDTLFPSFLKVKGETYYIQLKANIDLMQNSLIFIHPKTGKLLSVKSDIVEEVRIDTGAKQLVFRTTNGKKFEKDTKEDKFFEVLREGKFQFVKMPLKKLIPADYKEVYGADRRFDEYTLHYKYYCMNSDGTYRQIQLTRKSLIKIFPDKEELIRNISKEKSYENNEEMVLDILDKL